MLDDFRRLLVSGNIKSQNMRVDWTGLFMKSLMTFFLYSRYAWLLRVQCVIRLQLTDHRDIWRLVNKGLLNSNLSQLNFHLRQLMLLLQLLKFFLSLAVFLSKGHYLFFFLFDNLRAQRYGIILVLFTVRLRIEASWAFFGKQLGSWNVFKLERNAAWTFIEFFNPIFLTDNGWHLYLCLIYFVLYVFVLFLELRCKYIQFS